MRMHAKSTLPFLVLALLAATMSGCLGGSSKGSAKEVLRFEAENRATDAGLCSNDGGRMGIETSALAEQAKNAKSPALRFPEDGCWAEWSLSLPKALPLSLVAGMAPNNAGATAACHYWKVSVDGARLGATAPQCAVTGRWGWIDRSVFSDGATEPAKVPAGTHTVRITMVATDGPTSEDGFLDAFRFLE